MDSSSNNQMTQLLYCWASSVSVVSLAGLSLEVSVVCCQGKDVNLSSPMPWYFGDGYNGVSCAHAVNVLWNLKACFGTEFCYGKLFISVVYKGRQWDVEWW